jgi:hypothetical protein
MRIGASRRDRIDCGPVLFCQHRAARLYVPLLSGKVVTIARGVKTSPAD